MLPDSRNDMLPIETVDFSELLGADSNISEIDKMLDTFGSELEQHSLENFLEN